MLICIIFAIILFSHSFELSAQPQKKPAVSSAITYTLSGRFGDNMLTLYKALWLSQKYGIPLLYKEFPYADQLIFSTLFVKQNQVYAQEQQKLVIHKVPCKNEAILKRSAQDKALYVINYFTRCCDWFDWDKGLFLKKNDKNFINYLKKIVRPCKEYKPMNLPSDMVTVAVHVRKGGGYDPPLFTEQTQATQPPLQSNYIDRQFPLKFPPDVYYTEQLKALSHLFGDRPLYVYLFTDDPNPKRLADKFAEELNNSKIILDYRKQDNAHNAHVVEDFFALTQFNCLIRGDSSYSKAAQLLGSYSVVIYPEHCFWQGLTLVIDKIAIIKKGM